MSQVQQLSAYLGVGVPPGSSYFESYRALLAFCNSDLADIEMLAILQAVVKKGYNLVEADLWASSDIADCLDADDKAAVDRLAARGPSDDKSSQACQSVGTFEAELATFRKAVGLAKAPPETGESQAQEVGQQDSGGPEPACAGPSTFVFSRRGSFVFPARLQGCELELGQPLPH